MASRKEPEQIAQLVGGHKSHWQGLCEALYCQPLAAHIHAAHVGAAHRWQRGGAARALKLHARWWLANAVRGNHCAMNLDDKGWPSSRQTTARARAITDYGCT